MPRGMVQGITEPDCNTAMAAARGLANLPPRFLAADAPAGVGNAGGVWIDRSQTTHAMMENPGG